MDNNYDESIRLFFEELRVQAEGKNPGKRLIKTYHRKITKEEEKVLYKSLLSIARLFGVKISFYKKRKYVTYKGEKIRIDGEVVLYKDNRTIKIILDKENPHTLLHELLHVADFILSGSEDETDEIKDELIAHLAEYIIMSELIGKYSPKNIIVNILSYSIKKESFIPHLDYIKTMTNFFLYMYSLVKAKDQPKNGTRCRRVN